MPKETVLEAGRFRLCLDGVDLRYVEADGVEVLRRAFVTARDAEWNTPELTGVATEVEETPAGLTIAARARAQLGELDAACHIEVTVGAAVEYAVTWEPAAPFAYNRMGLCVLHPPATAAGRAYRVWRPEGEDRGTLPDAIGPQLVEDGNPQPLFPAFAALEIDVPGLGPCRLSFSGDLFEMEDQRNWSDGSFKTYCTPLSVPRPHRADPAHPVRQAVRLELPAARTPARPRAAVVALECEDAAEGAIPRLGLCWRPGAPAAVAGLGLDHLRVDLRRPERAAADLAAAAEAARAAGCSLTVAAHVPLPGGLEPHADVIAFVLAFAGGDLPGGVPRAGGTDGWFVDLNRNRPDPAAIDGVAWSVTPQVHASDELTMVEALGAQTDQLTTARGIAGDLPLLVGPITLRPRYNPDAADAAAQALDPPTSSIDPRQDSPFAAAWTAGSIAAQAAGGAWSATYYETHGPRGAAGPVLDVLRAATGWRGRPRLRSTSSAPLAAQLLAVAGGDGWLINLRARATRVRVAGGDVTELAPWEVRPLR